jgi:hypothetical protein
MSPKGLKLKDELTVLSSGYQAFPPSCTEVVSLKSIVALDIVAVKGILFL